MGDGLIIWLNPFSGSVKEVGMIHYEGNNMNQIYLEDSKTARFPDQQKYVDLCEEEIEVLFSKAQDLWLLSMPYANR